MNKYFCRFCATLFIFTLAFWSSPAFALSGKYKCNRGLIETMEFRSASRVVIQAMGVTTATTYTVDGKYLYVKHDRGGEFSYLIQGGKLIAESDVLLKKAVCTK